MKSFTLSVRKYVLVLNILLFSSFAFSQTCATTPISTYPYSENFDSSIGEWTQDTTNDDINWTRDRNGTPSGGTGPTTTGVGNTYYMFTEASGNNVGYPNKHAYFESPCFNLSGTSTAEFSFDYHMFSSNNSMGVLHVDVSTDNGATYNTTLWTNSGNAQPFQNFGYISSGNINLNAYVGSTIKLRFRGITGAGGSGWSSDMAIDNILLNATSNPQPDINVTGLGNTIPDGNTAISTTDDTNFGTILVSAGSAVHTFTIENLGSTGNIIMPINPVSITGSGDFSTTQPSDLSLSAGQTTTFEVTFDPSSVGTKNAIVTILNNDPDVAETSYTFSIRGVGSNSIVVAGPGNIGGNLQLWMKANSGTSTTTNNQRVDTWGDNSTNTLTATKGSTNGPTYLEDNINFNPALRFTRSGGEYMNLGQPAGLDFTPTPTASNSSSMSVFAAFLTDQGGAGTIVSKGDNSSGRSYQLWLGDTDRVVHYTLGRLAGASANASNGGINYGTIHARNDPKISSAVIDVTNPGADPNTSKILRYVNGFLDPLTIKADGDNGFGTGELDVDVLIGARRNSGNSGRGNLLQGNIGEIIIYDRVLSATERQKIETYLAIKYGITLGYNDEYYKEEENPDVSTFGYSGTSNNYILSNNSIAWTGSDNSGYGYNVFGIARDDYSGLIQLKSKSVHIEEITKSTSILTIEDESSSIENDRDYLLTGNNGATVSLTSSGVPERVSTMLNRKYKTRESSNDVGTIKLDFDLTQYPSVYSATPNDLRLIVSKNENLTNYKSYGGTYSSATRTITFTGINLEDSDYFTLGKVEELQNSYHFTFNGSSTYVELDNTLNLNPGGFTISAWVKRQNGNNRSILSKRNSAYTEGFDFRLTNAGRLQISWYNGGSLITVTTPNSVRIPINKWHHVAAIYEAGRITLYIDGVASTSVNRAAPSSTNQAFLIGASGKDNPGNFFRGDIDEVRVWDVPLSVSQLRYIMNQEVENNSNFIGGSYFVSRSITPTKDEIGSISWTSLAAYYPFSHVRGNCLLNKSSYTNENGRLFNTPNALIKTQTTPLPYFSTQNGDWNSTNTWQNGNVQNIPGTESVVDSDISVDWNIVRTTHNIAINDDSDLPTDNSGNRTVLALFNDSNEILVDGDNADAAAGHGLTVSHYLKIDGKIDLEGQSQLVQGIGSDLDPTSSGTLEKDQQGTADLHTYNYWSSPVGETNATTNNNSYSVTDVMFDGVNPINFSNSGYDGSDGSTITIADYWIWKFANQPDDDYSAWQHVRANGTLNAGEGFTMKGPGSGTITDQQNYVFLGKPNNGDINLTLNAGNDYLVGNPYPSAINADTFITDNGPNIAGVGASPLISGTLYFWEHWGGGSHTLAEYQGGYATYNFSGGVGAASIGTNDPDVATGGTPTKIPGKYIPVSQGFFVVGETTGTINFNNGQRDYKKEKFTGIDSSVFVRNSNSTANTSDENEAIDERMKFRIGFNSINTIHRQLLLTIDSTTTTGYDWAYDAKIYDNQMDDLYWIIDNEKYTIQGSNEAEPESVYPLGIITVDDGLNTITIDKLENVPDSIDIFIHDLENDTYHNLRTEDFQFILPAGEYLDRFELTFRDANADALSVEDLALKTIDAFYNLETESIALYNPNLADVKSIALYNIIGQEITKIENISELDYSEYQVKNLSSGTYIIKIDTLSGLLSQKVLVK